MNDSSSKERLFLGGCALVLFVAGLLMPFLIATVVLVSCRQAIFAEHAALPLAVDFGFIAEVLALVLGFFGRRNISGQIGMVGALTVFVLIFVIVAGVALSW